MNKIIMKLACIFNGWLNKKYGVISASTYLAYGKEVQLKKDTFIKMFKNYDRIDNYTGNYDKLYVREEGVTYFTLVEREAE